MDTGSIILKWLILLLPLLQCRCYPLLSKTVEGSGLEKDRLIDENQDQIADEVSQVVLERGTMERAQLQGHTELLVRTDQIIEEDKIVLAKRGLTIPGLHTVTGLVRSGVQAVNLGDRVIGSRLNGYADNMKMMSKAFPVRKPLPQRYLEGTLKRFGLMKSKRGRRKGGRRLFRRRRSW